LIAEAILILLLSMLIAESAYRRRKLRNDSEQNKRKQKQLLELSHELKSLKRNLARKCEIADQIPLIAQKLAEKLPQGSFPAIAVRFAKSFFHAKQVGFFVPLCYPEYTLEVGVNFPADWQKKIRIKADEGILGMALQKKVVVARTDRFSSAGRRPSQSSLEQLGVVPDYVAPVFGASGIMGAIVIGGCPFPLDEERKYVSMLADLLSTALQNAMLIDSSLSSAWADHLTGVSNRLHFLQRLESEIRRTQNYCQPLALFMFDIDEFKKINDTYGHAAGDVVIKALADTIRRNTRSSDLVGRFGGDEFMVLMTSSTREQAQIYADHLREKIASAEIRIPGCEAPIRLTISGGLAVYPSNGQSASELLRAADEALYAAKRNGRNQTVLAQLLGLDGSVIAEPEEKREKPAPAIEDPGDDGKAGEFPLGAPGEVLRP
jgi:diguanylate cyclase (GGDEF)-like protein